MLTLNMTISGTICEGHRLGAEPADPEIRTGSSGRAAYFWRGAHSSSRNVSLMKHVDSSVLAAAHTSQARAGVKSWYGKDEACCRRIAARWLRSSNVTCYPAVQLQQRKVGAMRWLVGVAAACALLAGSAPARACVASHWQLDDHASVIATARLEAPSGMPCITPITVTGRSNIRVDQQPAHGRLEVTDEGYIYTADDGYTGLDAFRVTWRLGDSTIRHGVEILVTVVPPSDARPQPPTAAPRATDPAAPRASTKPTAGILRTDGLGLYGMLVYSPQSRTYGFSVNQTSVDAALRVAQRECGRGDCVVMTPLRSQDCVAFAVGDAGHYWLRTRGSDPTARTLERCGQRTTNCQLVVMRCM
jgi:hypothetical protein